MKVFFLLIVFILALPVLATNKPKLNERKLEDRAEVILSDDNKNTDGHTSDEVSERQEYEAAELRAKDANFEKKTIKKQSH